MEIIASISDLENVVEQLLAYAKGRKKFLLSAEMGSGKTTFVNAFALHLNVENPTSSPTYSLINEYSYLENGAPQLMRHLDLYRLNSLQEAKDIGIEDVLDDAHYAFIEWPEIIEPLLYGDEIRINIEIMADNRRKFVFL
jgi:tRNA threonylcarbamoyladenosine biosynthesis protein TsaE